MTDSGGSENLRKMKGKCVWRMQNTEGNREPAKDWQN